MVKICVWLSESTSGRVLCHGFLHELIVTTKITRPKIQPLLDRFLLQRRLLAVQRQVGIHLGHHRTQMGGKFDISITSLLHEFIKTFQVLNGKASHLNLEFRALSKK